MRTNSLSTIIITGLLAIVCGFSACSNSPTAPDNSGQNTPPPVPAAPSGLSATVTNGVVTLTWSDTTATEDGFIVYRQLGTKAPFPLDTLPPNTTSYTDATPDAGKSYRYSVRAYNSAGESPATAQVVVSIAAEEPALAAPSNLTIRRKGDSLQISWTDNSSDESGFELHATSDRFGRGSADTLAVDKNQTAVTIPIPPPGNWELKVRAVRGRDFSKFSNTVTWTTASSSKPDVTVTETGSGWPSEVAPGEVVYLSGWALGYSGDSTMNIASSVYFRPSSDALQRDVHRLTSLPSMRLSPGTEFPVSQYYIVVPNDASDGNYILSMEGDPEDAIDEANETNNMQSVVFAVATPQGPDLAITSTVFVASPRPADAGQTVAVSGIDFKNIGTEPSGTFAVGYFISDDPTVTGSDFPLHSFSASLTAGSSQSFDAINVVIPPHLESGRYYIGAVLDYPNTIDEIREDNNTVSIVIDINGLPSTSPPDAPSGLSVTRQGTSAQLSWQDNSDDEHGFQLQWSSNANFSNASNKTLIANQTSHQLDGFAAGTYYFRIRAHNQFGSSGYSNAATMTVTNGSSSGTIRIVNNLSGSGSNRVLRLRLGPDQHAIQNFQNTEQLEVETYCAATPGADIGPGEAASFDVSSIGANYSVHIGLGIWDFDNPAQCPGGYAKKMWSASPATNFDLHYIHAQFDIIDHTAGELIVYLEYNAQDQLVARVNNSTVPFVVSVNQDPVNW